MDPIRALIVVALAIYGVYAASFLVTMSSPPVVITLFVAFLLKTVIAIAAAVAVWSRFSWDVAAVILLGVVIAATWLFEGFVLGIVAYLYALLAALVTIGITLVIVAYLSGWFGLRVSIEGGSQRLS